MSQRVKYWTKIAASLTEEEKTWLTRSRNRKLAGGRKLTNAEIGAKIGKPAHWVSGVCLILGSRSRMRNRVPPVELSEQDVALFSQMWAAGVSCTEIARRWGCQGDWASVRAQKLGLPPRNNTVTARQVSEIKRRLQAGESRPVIARALGIARSTVFRYSQGIKAPPPRRKGPPRKVDGGLADRMARTGMLHKEIAARFGVSRAAVSKAIKVYRKRLDLLAAKKPKVLIPPVKPAAFLRDAA